MINQSLHLVLLAVARLQHFQRVVQEAACLENVKRSHWREIWFSQMQPVEIRPRWTFDTEMDNAN